MEFVTTVTTDGGREFFFLVSYFLHKTTQNIIYFLSNLYTFCVIQDRICAEKWK